MNWRSLRRGSAAFFRGTTGSELEPDFARATQSFNTVQILVRAYYCFLAFLAIYLLRDWPGIIARENALPLWPVAWLPLVPARTGNTLILLSYLGGTLLAMALPGSRSARFLAFLGVLEWTALNNSFGKIGHSMHLLVLTSFIFIFLPTGWNKISPRRLVRLATLQVFWGAQAVILLTYTMAGLIKLAAGVYQLSRGEVSVFHPEALAWHISDRLLETNSVSFCGAWLIDHPWVCWPLMLSAVYLEFFSFWVLFRPEWQSFWAVSLILFHVGSYFTMTIIFPQSCFLLALFFCHPVLAGSANEWRKRLASLPLFGGVAAGLLRRAEAGRRVS